MLSHLICISIIIQITTGQVAFVGLGSNSPTPGKSVAYSLDGISWTSAAQNIFSNVGNWAVYSQAQNKWMAAGSGTVNTLAWSPDGIVWTGLGLTVFSTAGYGIAYSAAQNRWVAVGQGANSIYYSTDGFTWTPSTPAVFDIGNGVTYSSALNQWVAVGGGTINTIAVSSDGITWTGLGKAIFPNQAISVNYANGVYVVTGMGTITQAWSDNGITWTSTPEFISTIRYNSVYAQGRWLLVGPSPVHLQNSTDGKSWTNKPNVIGITDIRGITYNPAYNRYVAIGSGTNNIIYSSDGDNWNTASISGTVFNSFTSMVATSGFLSQIVSNPTPLTADIVNLMTNTSIVNQNVTIAVSGNFTVLGDLAVEGTWILTKTASVNITGLLNIKGNTTFNSLQPINCNSLTISSAIGDSKLEVPLDVNLTLGSSISYPVITYSSRSGVFRSITVRSAPTVSLTSNDCPLATQDYSSSTLTVTVTMTRCGGNPPIETFATNSMSTALIVGIAVGCAVLAAAVILVVVLLMRRHRDRADAIANLNLKQASINDLKVAQNRHTPAIE